ncbi:arginyl-tRNA--protein transferase 1-like isoform X2 [Montipora capricornis]|uniref:arginyl-tRNA--protein transferase 1-like isoform X2 n=1 Tax=Montipora capricornis TaxID=246305 RepID=UPI0035F12D78
MSNEYSIVEYFGGDSEGHRCGYCKSSNTNFSHGMWAHTMTCWDYQDLIDRGWRRSGNYVYKPTMKKLCCPMYTIKCDAGAFNPSKSQKKVLKKMTKFLTVAESGQSSSQDKGGVSLESQDDGRTHFVEPLPGRVPSESHKIRKTSTDKQQQENNFFDESKLEVLQLPKVSPVPTFSKKRNSDQGDLKTESKKGKTPAPGVGPDSSKPPCQKAKVLRLQRKRQKLALAKEKGIVDLESSLETPRAPVRKSLEDLLIDRLPSQPPVHDLQVKLVLSDPNNVEFRQSLPQSAKLFFKYQEAIHKDPPEKCTEKRVKLVRVNMDSQGFQETFKQTCDLFAKYQIAIHRDSPGDCGKSQFRRFLVDSPLEHYTESGAPPMGFGSFHQQYFVDGKLIAVGVLDILPRCVSSVYFFYDPDYGFLSPGVYSALRELCFTRSLLKATPSIASYYMGFYIHSCPKMKYKGQYNPSFLVCPETFNWIPIERCVPKLDRAGYARLDDSNEEPPKGSTDDVLVLYKHQAMPYKVYKLMSKARDGEEVEEYAELVGPLVASRMLLYRSG